MAIEKEAEILTKVEKLFEEENYVDALKLFSESVEDKSSKFYEKKSECLFKLQKYADSIDAANFALDYDSQSEFAFLQKGICLFALEEFENSKYVLEKGLKFSNEYEKEIKRWIRKCNIELEFFKKKETQPTIRFNWYQTQSSVVISLVVKNKKEQDAILKFTPNSFYAEVKEGNENLIKEFEFYEEINPENVKINYFSSKIEVSLEKKNHSVDWAQLEKEKDEKPKVFDPKKYVSVQKKKDWNELNNKFKEEDEKEIPKGDAAMNILFQKIYASGSEETKRAMMKSYVESKGTVLSTNWSEVGSKKVECTPPQGMKEFEK